ncbi:MAG: NUDIX hydrolase [Chlamydiales bacterium]|nr:NUDIX hydrolase [Chlamydiales bacterium]
MSSVTIPVTQTSYSPSTSCVDRTEISGSIASSSSTAEKTRIVFESLEERPADFKPIKCKIVACVCYLDANLVDVDGNVVTVRKILCLQRDRAKEGQKKIDWSYHWGLPAGKVEDGETYTDAMIREVLEETGKNIRQQQADGKIPEAREVYVREPREDNPSKHTDFVFEIYQCAFPAEEEQIEVPLEQDKHVRAEWLTTEELLDGRSIIPGIDESIAIFERIWKQKSA